MRKEDFAADQVIHVWPENWAAVCFFADVPNGAWSVGPGGVTGLRPEALREVREALGISSDEWRSMYRDVMLMEAEALKAMNDEAKRKHG